MKFSDVLFNKVDWSSVYKNLEFEPTKSSHNFEAFAQIWEGNGELGVEDQKNIMIKFSKLENYSLEELRNIIIENSKNDFFKYEDDSILVIDVLNNDQMPLVSEIKEKLDDDFFDLNKFSDVVFIVNNNTKEEKIISLSNGNELNFSINKY